MKRNILVVGDVGAWSVLHAGDEAMLDAAVTEMSARLDVRWTVVSAEPVESAARYGMPAVPHFGFPAGASDQLREARLVEILEAARGDRPLELGDPALATLDAVAGSDAVLIAGGGNLAAAWPQQVYERAALAGAATALSVPVVLTGQGLGPQFTERLGALVAGALTSARFVGVREARSAALAAQLGVHEDRIWCATDDAAFLTDEVFDLRTVGVTEGQFVAVTFSAYGGFTPESDFVDRLAHLLDVLVDETGLDVLLVPHLSAVASLGHDEQFHQVLLHAAKSDRILTTGPLPPRQLAWIAGQAALVVSNRYHPVVFALHRGVPVVALCVDDYTEQKIRGSMEMMGVADWALAASAPVEVIIEAIAECWRRRDELHDVLVVRARSQQELKTRYWDTLCEALAGGPVGISALTAGGTSGVTSGQGGWVVRNQDALVALQDFSRYAADLQRQLSNADGLRDRVMNELHQVRLDHNALQDSLAALAVEVTVERAAGDVARSERARELEEAAADRALLRWALDERATLQRTKLMRWSKLPRAVYRAARRL